VHTTYVGSTLRDAARRATHRRVVSDMGLMAVQFADAMLRAVKIPAVLADGWLDCTALLIILHSFVITYIFVR
jgi:hypothetical protein